MTAPPLGATIARHSRKRAAPLSTEGQKQRMPLIIKLPKNAEIDILGVKLKAESQCALSINDHNFAFIKESDQAPRRIVRAEDEQ